MRKRRLLIAAAAAAVVGLTGGGIAVATGAADGEGTVSGPQAEAATRAALQATDGGTANSVERDNESGATWEVEVTRPDGTTVDVRLDDQLGVVVIEGDSDRAGDTDGDNAGPADGSGGAN